MNEPLGGSFRTDAFTIDTDAYAWALVCPKLDVANVALLILVVLLSVGLTIRKGPLAGGRVVLVAVLIQAVFIGLAFVRAQRRSKRNDANGLPRSFEFSEAAITIRIEGRRDSEIPWTRVLRVARCGGFTFLYREKELFWPLPDRSFRSKDDHETFLRLLDRRGLWPVRK